MSRTTKPAARRALPARDDIVAALIERVDTLSDEVELWRRWRDFLVGRHCPNLTVEYLLAHHVRPNREGGYAIHIKD